VGSARFSPAETEQGVKYKRDQAYDGKERPGGQRYVVAHPIK